MEEEEKKELEDQFSKTRTDEEDEQYLEAIVKEAKGGKISKVSAIKNESESIPEQLEEVEEAPEEETVEEEVVEEVLEEEIEEEVVEEEPEEEVLVEPSQEDGSEWEDPFEEDESAAIKKYIFGISMDYVDLIDEMELDERSAFVNDAIQTKLDKERADEKRSHKQSIVKHIMLTVVTTIVGIPLMFWVVNKSIEVTILNYARTQQNFEKLYTQQAKTDAAIKRVQEELKK